jgi:3-hydroxyacyl-[acyl-carrier-protein] dehydratase
MTNIRDLLPHREPFIFVDALESVSMEEIRAFRVFKPEEKMFEGHFPGYPIVPGVILIEAMAQAGGAGVKELSVTGGFFVLGVVEKAKFRRQVRPGERVDMVIHNLKLSRKIIRQKGKALVGGELAAEAEWLCLMMEEKS